MLKTCYKCSETKEVSLFGKNKSKKDGLSTECRTCKRLVDNAYSAANREKAKLRANAWYYQNLDKAKQNNREYGYLWVRANKDKNCAKAGKYRASKLNATPSWLTVQDWDEINVEYSLAQWVSTVMKTEYHVDHIVPLQGKDVCGLHVPWNLRVIPALANYQKGNRSVL